MKKILYINVIVIIILIFTAGASKIEKSEDKILNEILCNRVAIMNDYLFNNKNLLQTEKELKIIESNKLLKNDIRNLNDFIGTDIDKIVDTKILKYNYQKSSYGYIIGKVKIKFTSINNTKKNEDKIWYDVRFEKNNSRYKITKLEKI